MIISWVFVVMVLGALQPVQVRMYYKVTKNNESTGMIYSKITKTVR